MSGGSDARRRAEYPSEPDAEGALLTEEERTTSGQLALDRVWYGAYRMVVNAKRSNAGDFDLAERLFRQHVAALRVVLASLEKGGKS